VRLAKPDDFNVVIVGTSKDRWLKERLTEDIEAGRVTYLDREDEEGREVVTKLLGEDPPDGPVAVVMDRDAEEGEACVLSAIGESLIIHCEDQVIPLKGPAGE
jgi:hypothetical protein